MLAAFTLRIVLAHQYHDETCYNHAYYACLDGLSAAEVSCLEEDFLQRIDYSLFVSTTEYASFYNKLCSSHNASIASRGLHTALRSLVVGSYLPLLAVSTSAQGDFLSYASSSRDAQHKLQYYQQQFQSFSIVPIPIAMAPVPLCPLKPVPPFNLPIIDSPEELSSPHDGDCGLWASTSVTCSPSLMSRSSTWDWNPHYPSNAYPCYCVPIQPIVPSFFVPLLPFNGYPVVSSTGYSLSSSNQRVTML